MNLRGDVIEESLSNKDILKELQIVATRVENVTPEHKTPWLTQWTLHTIEVPPKEAADLAEKLSHCLEGNYWYIDFKNESEHYIIFPEKVFKIDRARPEQYKAAVTHGLSLKIPRHQLDFSPAIRNWER